MNKVDCTQENHNDFLLKETNRCVSCGLCLPHCPTYRLTLSEADSPRGRIALMSGVASGRIPLNERFVTHMDRCLTCRACETVCPNNVAYGKLIDETRAMIATTSSDATKGLTVKNKPWLRKTMEQAFIVNPARFDRLRLFFRLFQRSGLQRWIQKTKLVKHTAIAKLVVQLPLVDLPCTTTTKHKKLTRNWLENYPAVGAARGEVSLFLGCIARLADVTTLNSSIFVLTNLGYNVHIPPSQTCCGALHQHSGDCAVATELAQQNQQAFRNLSVSAIITTASGCGTQLAEYQPTALTQNKSTATQFAKQVIDINKFLVSAEGWENVKIKPLAAKVMVHDPCSLRNGLHCHTDAYAVLNRISDLQVVPLADNNQCCGAAGTYFLDQPEMATKLQAEKVSATVNTGASYLATSNIGCALHIASGLKTTASNIEVLHPVTLLARQIEPRSLSDL